MVVTEENWRAVSPPPRAGLCPLPSAAASQHEESRRENTTEAFLFIPFKNRKLFSYLQRIYIFLKASKKSFCNSLTGILQCFDKRTQCRYRYYRNITSKLSLDFNFKLKLKFWQPVPKSDRSH